MSTVNGLGEIRTYVWMKKGLSSCFDWQVRIQRVNFLVGVIITFVRR